MLTNEISFAVLITYNVNRKKFELNYNVLNVLNTTITIIKISCKKTWDVYLSLCKFITELVLKLCNPS